MLVLHLNLPGSTTQPLVPPGPPPWFPKLQLLKPKFAKARFARAKFAKAKLAKARFAKAKLGLEHNSFHENRTEKHNFANLTLNQTACHSKL